jgi:hypothetical protein
MADIAEAKRIVAEMDKLVAEFNAKGLKKALEE